MSRRPIQIATAQSRVSSDARDNGREVRRLMQEVGSAACQVDNEVDVRRWSIWTMMSTPRRTRNASRGRLISRSNVPQEVSMTGKARLTLAAIAAALAFEAMPDAAPAGEP